MKKGNKIQNIFDVILFLIWIAITLTILAFFLLRGYWALFCFNALFLLIGVGIGICIMKQARSGETAPEPGNNLNGKQKTKLRRCFYIVHLLLTLLLFLFNAIYPFLPEKHTVQSALISFYETIEENNSNTSRACRISFASEDAIILNHITSSVNNEEKVGLGYFFLQYRPGGWEATAFPDPWYDETSAFDSQITIYAFENYEAVFVKSAQFYEEVAIENALIETGEYPQKRKQEGQWFVVPCSVEQIAVTIHGETVEIAIPAG